MVIHRPGIAQCVMVLKFGGGLHEIDQFVDSGESQGCHGICSAIGDRHPTSIRVISRVTVKSDTGDTLGYYVSERTLILCDGCVVDMGSTEKTYQKPLHPFSKILMNCLPCLDQEWKEIILWHVLRWRREQLHYGFHVWVSHKEDLGNSIIMD